MSEPLDPALPVAPSALRFAAFAMLGPLLLAAIAGWLGHNYAESETLRQEARAALDRRTVAVTLLPQIADAQSSQRGFIITGDDRFLKSYALARRDVFATFARLDRDFSAAEPEQLQRLRTMRALAQRRFAEMDETIVRRRTAGVAAAAELVGQEAGQVLMERMRVESAGIMRAADGERDGVVATFQRGIASNMTTIWVGIATIGLIVLTTTVAFWEQSMVRYRARLQAYDIAERNRTILDSTIDAMAIINPAGKIDTCNRAAAALLGYPIEEMVGLDVSQVVRLVVFEGSFLDRVGLVEGELANPYLADRTLLHRDGYEIPVDIAMGVLDTPHGTFIVVSARDVSDRKRIARLKDELMSTVSHELRTPLTSVVGALGLLRGGSVGVLPAPATRLIEIAENNSRRLIRLINDMLDIDRIQSGELQLARVPIDLGAVVDRAAVGSQGLATAEFVQIFCTLPPRAVCVVGDADRLLQVITNLISNAVRASPTGGIVSIGVTFLAETGQVVVNVDDQGTGVPTAFRDRIFGRFERADGEQGVGTGLGLAISREIIARHDGQIWFEDRPDGGSRFAFALDVEPEQESASEPVAGVATRENAMVEMPKLTEPAAARPRDRRPTILHLDDDPDVLAVTETALQDEARILKATDLVTARALLRSERPDLAILDLHLPEGSGLHLLPMLIDERGVPVPTIIFSAHDVDPDSARAVDAVLVKSRGTLHDLRATVRRILDKVEHR